MTETTEIDEITGNEGVTMTAAATTIAVTLTGATTIGVTMIGATTIGVVTTTAAIVSGIVSG
eukprot:CAMPEP_0119339730 /NCGR_PEP_ID=MMETSP1333-20130426/98916_1 /TAXON_ID=418940 /ORGANISM="Scyphosphaera apsteinii, Strain RCC1455" /LENGTH=61 /DNA_ID=CAMNT_0007351313 /DNA_START=35 /DNA_END=217 /DNA_ORIENTATION=+